MLKGVHFVVLIAEMRIMNALVLSGVDIPHAKEASPISRALGESTSYPLKDFYTEEELRPMDPSNDFLFYVLPKFVHHAAEESRSALTEYYAAALPDNGAVLDICSSWTSHYPKETKLSRCAILGLNAFELLANPSKTEWTVRNLNTNPKLPYGDAEFDCVTNSLSVDYLTKPIEIFKEIRRVLKPGGLACMAFTNRCFPSKVVNTWLNPYTDDHHARVVANYFYHAGGFTDISVADCSPTGWTGMQNPMIIVAARRSS
mmetsp:Transcript_6028/g.8526  ORF Transcript_6028/g.8526 Transcript_6028/m.8526 type:complete len:259 (+) Transcript_6028:115-891(+)